MAIKRIGQVMIDHGFITPEQLDILLEKKKEVEKAKEKALKCAQEIHQLRVKKA